VNLNKRTLLLLATIILAGAVLRGAQLGHQGLFFDEAWSWAVTRLNTVDIVGLSTQDPHPPLYYILLKWSLLILPHSEAGLRTLSMLASVASLIVVVVYAARRWNSRAAAYAGLLMAVSSFDIYYAQDARMYTLLGLLWIVSYMSLVRGLEEGRPGFLAIWAVATALMPWVHVYGILFLLTGLALLLGTVLARQVFHFPLPWRASNRSWVLSAACVVISTLPMALLLSRQATGDAGGAWIPEPKDLVALFLLWSTGLASVRHYFLDGAHLVLPALASLPTSLWLLAGVATSGLGAAWGMVQAWRAGPSRRAEVVLTATLIGLPLAMAFGYGALTQHRIWALKPFLGPAYLMYLWAGVGISSLSYRWVRRGLGFALVILAVLSLWPYFSLWQKDASRTAFQSLPVRTESNAVIIEPAYLSPLAFYYLDASMPVLAITGGESAISISRILPPNKHPQGTRESIDCQELSSISTYWLYGHQDQIRQVVLDWPSCVVQKDLWVFDGSRWQRLNP